MLNGEYNSCTILVLFMYIMCTSLYSTYSLKNIMTLFQIDYPPVKDVKKDNCKTAVLVRQPRLVKCWYYHNQQSEYKHRTVEDDISAVSIAPISLPSSPSQNEDESSTSCPSPSSPIGGS